MLKKLLKYEFKATARTYGGMYLALLAASVLFGGSVWRWNGTNSDAYSTLVGLLSLVYTAVIIGTVVVTIMTIVQRFYRNLLGREGYLMHTLPVTETQLILSKLLTSMVWVLCSGLVGVVCITVMVAVGVFDPETFGMADWDRWKQLWGMLYGELGAEFWVAMVWTILINLARLASLILCVYAACMIAHQFKKQTMVAGILAFIGMNIVENQIDKLLGTNDVTLFVDVTYKLVDVSGGSEGAPVMHYMTAAFGQGASCLFCFVFTAAIAAVYFFLTRWLMKHKLNLE